MDITHRININTISKYTGVTNILMHTLPLHILCTLYIDTTPLILRFTSMGHNSPRLFKLQTRAIRTIICSKYDAHTEPLHKTLYILKLPDMYDLQLYKLYYNIQRKPVPHYFDTVISTLTHNYNTRPDTLE